MPATTPMKTAVALMRLTPDEKQRWQRMCEERDVSLSYAMREGLRLYLEEARERASREGPRVAT